MAYPTNSSDFVETMSRPNIKQKQPPKPEDTAKRRRNMAKARQVSAELARQRIAANRGELPDSDISQDPLAHLKPQLRGKTVMMDEVISAFLSWDDGVQSRSLVDAVSRKAMRGDMQAIMFLADRSQGRPISKVQVSGGLSVNLLDELLPDAEPTPTDEPPLTE